MNWFLVPSTPLRVNLQVHFTCSPIMPYAVLSMLHAHEHLGDPKVVTPQAVNGTWHAAYVVPAVLTARHAAQVLQTHLQGGGALRRAQSTLAHLLAPHPPAPATPAAWNSCREPHSWANPVVDQKGTQARPRDAQPMCLTFRCGLHATARKALARRLNVTMHRCPCSQETSTSTSVTPTSRRSCSKMERWHSSVCTDTGQE